MTNFNYQYSSKLPPLTDEEYTQLKSDIAKRGVLVPVIIDEFQNVIDGQHRLQVASELKLDDIPFDIRIGLSDSEKQQLAIDLNLHRRHLTREQRKEWSVRLRQEGMSYRQIGEKLGVDKETIRNDVSTVEVSTVELPETIIGKDGKQRKARKPVYATSKDLPKVKRIVEKSSEQPYLLDELAETGKIARGVKEVNRLEKLEKRQSQQVEIPNDSPIWHGDFRKVGQKIPDNSVDIIFTDPPYNENSIELYRDLGIFAERVLKPGGLCLAYSGQIFLPQVLNALGESLEYIWTFAVKHNGAYTRIFKPKVNNAWKPILMYCKLPYEVWWPQIIDLIEDRIDKSEHEWQQSTNAPDYYLDKLCPKDGLVVDPFCGSGTTLVSAKRLKLRYIGIEDDEGDVVKSTKRLDDIQA